jgi:hypothetical protein
MNGIGSPAAGEDDERLLAVAGVEPEVPLLDDDDHELWGEPDHLGDGGVLLGKGHRVGLEDVLPLRRRGYPLGGGRQRPADPLPGLRVGPEPELSVAALRRRGGARQRDQGNGEQGGQSREGRPSHGRSSDRSNTARPPEPGGAKSDRTPA